MNETEQQPGSSYSANEVDTATTGSTRAQSRRELKLKRKRKRIILFSSIGAAALLLGGSGTYLALGTATIPAAASYHAETEASDPCESFRAVTENCTVEFVHSDNIVRDKLISQSSDPGFSFIRPGSIALTYSSGPEESVFPDILRMDYDEAAKELYLLGIEVAKIEPVQRDDLDANRVVSSSIPKGEIAKSGTAVTLEVSTETVNLPDLRGLTREQAELDLQKLGLDGDVIEAESDQPVGTVIAQSAEPGTVAKGSEITVTIAKAVDVQTLKVPTVVGLTEEEAQGVIASAGFKNIAVVRVESSKATEARVSHVAPGEGRTARSDSNVVLVVSVPEA